LEAAKPLVDGGLVVHRQQKGKLVAAHPRQLGRRRQKLPQPLGNGLQHAIAHQVTKGLVDQLKAIDV